MRLILKGGNEQNRIAVMLIKCRESEYQDDLARLPVKKNVK
jgi:hypothetical protein